MIGRLNHVAIAVPDLEQAADQYRDTLGAKVGPPQDEPDHGVTVIFIELENTKIELLHPLSESSPIAGFLERNPSGGIHHHEGVEETGVVLRVFALGDAADLEVVVVSPGGVVAVEVGLVEGILVVEDVLDECDYQ